MIMEMFEGKACEAPTVFGASLKHVRELLTAEEQGLTFGTRVFALMQEHPWRENEPYFIEEHIVQGTAKYRGITHYLQFHPEMEEGILEVAWDMTADEMGKTVFLTLEEAEEALKNG